jgi:hypothetical protein
MIRNLQEWRQRVSYEITVGKYFERVFGLRDIFTPLWVSPLEDFGELLCVVRVKRGYLREVRCTESFCLKIILTSRAMCDSAAK